MEARGGSNSTDDDELSGGFDDAVGGIMDVMASKK